LALRFLEGGVVRIDAALEPHRDAAALAKGRVGHVDPVLAHAARVLEGALAELALLLLGQLRRLDILQVLLALLLSALERRGGASFGRDHPDSALTGGRVGHVHPVPPHALGVLEGGLASLRPAVAGSVAAVVATARGQCQGGGGDRQGEEEDSLGSHGRHPTSGA
jgi:hypothetical protein